MTMTPTHLRTPIRRSDIGVFRTPLPPGPVAVVQHTPVFTVVNDDEEERRQRRRTQNLDSSTASNLEENQKFKDQYQLCHENKLSKENAWSVSLIDTLSVLLSNHHKSFSNFKVAGSSLEASSKIYGLRVDSVHFDVVRLTSGLNKQKIVSEVDEPEEVDFGSTSSNANNDGEDAEQENGNAQPKPKKRQKKNTATVTKNVETLNAKLDTNPFTDPIFAKLNSIVGNINSAHRLLQSILESEDGDLRLRMDGKFWKVKESAEDLVVEESYDLTEFKQIDGMKFEEIKTSALYWRPQMAGYIISDQPADNDDGDKLPSPPPSPEPQNYSAVGLAFDINAEIEPITDDGPHFMDVDMDNFDDITPEDRLAIFKCHRLRREPVRIDDMRPLDSTSSQLEYSYRPMDKISQFWAGPSHWRFKKSRSLSIGIRLSALNNAERPKQPPKRSRTTIRNRTHTVPWGEVDDRAWKTVGDKTKLKKANIQKKWDPKKLKLPTDLQIDRNFFDVSKYALGTPVKTEVVETPDLQREPYDDYHDDVGEQFVSESQLGDNFANGGFGVDEIHSESQSDIPVVMNATVYEIATDFEGAPDKVTKIIVPFAKRAKVVDMKQLKRSCFHIVKKHFTINAREQFDMSTMPNDESYQEGFASFHEMYMELPKLLTPKMSEALSTSVAFYSVLHVANEQNLRLIPQADLKDFKIRQIKTA